MSTLTERQSSVVPKVIYDVSVRRMDIPYDVTVDAQKVANVLSTHGVQDTSIKKLSILVGHNNPYEDSSFEFDYLSTEVSVYCGDVWEENIPYIDVASEELNAHLLYALSHVIHYETGKYRLWYALAGITGLLDPILYRLDPTERSAMAFQDQNRKNPDMMDLIRIGLRT